jgi:hypothetical protein
LAALFATFLTERAEIPDFFCLALMHWPTATIVPSQRRRKLAPYAPPKRHRTVTTRRARYSSATPHWSGWDDYDESTPRATFLADQYVGGSIGSF